MNRRMWEQQLEDAFDGNLSDADAVALASRLRESPEFLDDWCDRALLETELQRQAAGLRKIPGAIPPAARLAGQQRIRRLAGISLASAAAILLLGTLVLRMLWVSPTPPATVSLAPGSVLIATDGSPTPAGELASKDTWTLGEGVAEIHLPNQVRALIDGPAVFRIVTNDRMEIRGGHSWFHVPAGDAGFRVITPELEVMDLGTAFGIELREDLPPQVHCLEGAVEIRARRGKRESGKLQAGQAAVLETNGRWTADTADPLKFRTNLPPQRPWLSLAFGDTNGDIIPLEGDLPGIHSTRARLIHPNKARITNDPAGGTLELDGAFIETDWPGISGTAPRTLATWCRLPAGYRPDTAPPLAVWGDPSIATSRKFKVAVVAQHAKTILRVSFGRFLINGSTELADGRWHHIAVTYAGNDPDGRPLVRMFVNGVEEEGVIVSHGDGEIRTETKSIHSVALSLGRYELPAGGRDPFLRAALRDYRIFAGTLDEEEIRRLQPDAPPVD